MQINPIITTLLTKVKDNNTSIDVKILIEDSCLVYEIEGFYKSGIIKLTENNDGSLTAHCRYDEKREIESYTDLLELNYDWWQRSRNRYDGWKAPQYGWDKLLIEAGMVQVKEEVIKKVTYS